MEQRRSSMSAVFLCDQVLACTESATSEYSTMSWSEDCFYYCSERNNVVILFETLKVQSFFFTEVSDCGLLIVVTSSTFLKRKDMLKEKKALSPDHQNPQPSIYIDKHTLYTYTIYLYGLHVYCALVDLDSPGVHPTPGLALSRPHVQAWLSWSERGTVNP